MKLASLLTQACSCQTHLNIERDIIHLSFQLYAKFQLYFFMKKKFFFFKYNNVFPNLRKINSYGSLKPKLVQYEYRTKKIVLKQRQCV